MARPQSLAQVPPSTAPPPTVWTSLARPFSANAAAAPAPAPPAAAVDAPAADEADGADLTPAEVVDRLNRHIVGQVRER